VGGKVFAFFVTARDAQTTKGVGIGDGLDLVAETYSGTRCDKATDEQDLPLYRYCTVALARERHIYFGEDPIGSIVMATTPTP
jgi:hypothetical protein